MGKEGVRSPTAHRTPAQTRALDAGYNARPENIAKRSNNNQARRIMEKKVGKAALAGKDVDHIKPQRSGGGNSKGNLRIRSQKANRGWERER